MHMRVTRKESVICACLFGATCLLLISCLSFPGAAERLPIKTYTTADGLARDHVNRIVRDSRGFLWFCTSEGLSRFDGYRFTNYGIEHGLPDRVVNDLLETSTGVYLVATNAGLCQFNPRAPHPTQHSPSTFVPLPNEQLPSRDVEVLFEDKAGHIWCGTLQGLFQAVEERGRWHFVPIDLRPASVEKGEQRVHALIDDQQGGVWIGLDGDLYHLQSNGRVTPTPVHGGPMGKTVPITALIIEDVTTLWVGTTVGLTRCQLDRQTQQIISTRHYTTKDGLAHDYVHALRIAADGRLRVATGKGLCEWVGDATKPFVSYGAANGLSDAALITLGEDRDGNLWLGSENGGAMKLPMKGFATFGEADGLGSTRVAALFFDQKKDLCMMSGQADDRLFLHRYANGKFASFSLLTPHHIPLSWGWLQVVFQDHLGEWWLPTRAGLVRYPAVSGLEQLVTATPKAIYTTHDGLVNLEIFRLYEDSRGDIWISTLGKPGTTIHRWERATGKLHLYTAGREVPTTFTNAPSAFAEDAAGNVWMGGYDGNLVRYSKGRFSLFTSADGVPPGFIRALYLDQARRLWVATAQGGAARVDDPTSAQPRFVVYNMANGLASNQATCVTDDRWGRIYIGTGRGLDRLDVATGRIKHYTTADGLASNFINVSLRDAGGALWFGTLQGLSRLVLTQEDTPPPPPALISSVRVAGVLYPVSEVGETNLTLPELSATQNQLQIEFLGLGLAAGEVLRYQVQLEGAQNTWSEPTEQRSVSYPNLPAGQYRFLVRALNAEGAMSATPASVTFRILPPLWQRWWVLTLLFLAMTTLIYLNVRARAVRWRAVRESETRFRTLAETASDAIITINSKGQIVFANPAVEKVFGYRVEEMLGQDLTMLMPEYLRHMHQTGLGRYQRTGQKHVSWEAIELPGLHRDGHEIPLEISFGEFAVRGQRFFTGVARDITERKRAAEALQRSREERFAELERVRQRIATDLHDDIGSSLTQISILSEVMQQRIGPNNHAAQQPLTMIAGASRELVDAMSDIVWAINPQKDHLRDLTQRMRRFAADSLTARNIRFRLELPETDADMPMGANLRRELFLIFKESVNNLVKHANCTEAEIELKLLPEALQLRLRDNGCGFDLAQASDGHGLMSMQSRAASLGGELTITSPPGQGTEVRFTLPLHRANGEHSYINS